MLVQSVNQLTYNLIIFFTIVLMTACNDREYIDMQYQTTDKEIKFTGQIAWNTTGGEISPSINYPVDFGIGALENNLLYANNLRYILNQGKFTPKGEALQYPGSGKALVFAYAPYQENANSTSIELSAKADQQNSNPEESDPIWASQSISKDGNTHSLKFTHKFAKVILQLKPRGEILSADTKVRLLNVKLNAQLNLSNGAVTDSHSAMGNILLRKIDAIHYEAIIPPQAIGTRQDFVEVTGGGRLYKMKLKSPKTLLSNTIHRFVVDVNNETQHLPCSASLKYNQSKLGNTLSVLANAQKGSLDMSIIPDGSFLTLKLRNASGGNSWVKIDNNLGIRRDEIWNGRSEGLLTFDENTGEERSVYLEFYDKNQPGDVYHYMCITQAAAIDYLNINQQSLTTDRYGNVYDKPLKLAVKSNRSWQIANTPDWIDAVYTPGQRSQEVRITVKENKTGVARNANIEFIQQGIIVKSFPIFQSATAETTFTLKYEFEFEFNTRDNRFMYRRPNGAKLYANEVSVFNNVGAGDAIAKINSNNKYGFVVDAPNSFNKLIVTNFANDYFIVRNYNGSAQTIFSGDANIVNRAVPFFRQIKIGRLNIPPGVRRDQKVKFKVVINNLVNNATHDTPVITTTVVDQ